MTFDDAKGRPAFAIKPTRALISMTRRLTDTGGAIRAEKRGQVEEGGVKGFFKTLLANSDPLRRLRPVAIESCAETDVRLLRGFMLLLYEITVPLERST